MSDAVNRLKNRRPVAQLAPEPPDDNVHDVAAALIPRLPNGVKEFVTSHHLTLPLPEITEHRELARR
jgi:hypothetical protein